MSEISIGEFITLYFSWELDGGFELWGHLWEIGFQLTAKPDRFRCMIYRLDPFKPLIDLERE